VSGRSAGRESGFTLVEIVIAVAIVATTVAAGFGISLASRSLAVSTAADEFDQFLDSARTMARDLDGATLAFTADAYGDGTEVRLYAGGPNGPPAPTTLPTLHARATIEEAESLGKAPFAFIVHANGSLSGRPNYRIGDTTTNDVGCPASGAFHFVIKAAGGSADRYVPCRIKLAANGPVTLTAWPPASPAPSPTPCSSGPGCTATSLPSAPTSTASCPPNFTAIPGGCAPAPPSSSGARYHVTVTGAPATLTVGATASFTAQATLTNPTAVSAETPASIPVAVQSADTTCTATPPGWQQSGASFTVAGVASGTCSVTAGADTSGVAGATSDTASVALTITANPTPAPTGTAALCDLVTNEKCFRRIIDVTTKSFSKTVSADTKCDDTQSGKCTYLDSIRSISLDEFSLTPSVPPVDETHELLFRINSIDSLLFACMPYSTLSTFSASDSLQLIYGSIGGAANRPIGFGNPSLYATINRIFLESIPESFEEKRVSREVVPTVFGMVDDLARTKPGVPYSFTYFSSAAMPNSKIIWLPDFPSCDNAGDPQSAGTEYGNVIAAYVFEVFQATP
jgi:prepilin-type N-terminal cleavage/methylation domain-containing protein